MKKTKIIFNILTVFAYFYALLFCATMVLIPLGIYGIIAAHRFSDFAEYTPFQLSQNKTRITNWIIFGCFGIFPFGLLGLLCLSDLNNNIDVQSAENDKNSETESQQNSTEHEKVEVEIHTPQSESEKAEKLAKLKRFKENGLITEEEYQQAKNDLYGETD